MELVFWPVAAATVAASNVKSASALDPAPSLSSTRRKLRKTLASDHMSNTQVHHKTQMDTAAHGGCSC